MKPVGVEARNEFLTENYALLVYFGRKLENKYSTLFRDIDDALSFVHESAMRAYDYWDDSKGSFANALWLSIWHDLSVYQYRVVGKEPLIKSDTVWMQTFSNDDLVDRGWLNFSAPDFSDDVLSALNYEQLISACTKGQREVLNMFYQNDLNVAAIARERGVSPQAVSQQLQKAYARIKDACLEA